MMKRTLVIAALGMACKSDSSPKPEDPQPKTIQPPAPTALKECKDPKPEECNWFQCGGNSPVVNGFPVNGIRPDGECNEEGVQLVPESMTGGVDGACAGTTLDVRFSNKTNRSELVGITSSDKSIACDGAQLAGASFVVRSWAKKDLTITITKVEDYVAENGEVRTAYEMTAGGESLCKADASAKAREALGIGSIPGLKPDSDKTVLIPIESELYDRQGHAFPPDPKWQRNRAEWLNLACVGDALAKRSLYGLHTDNVEDSRAALMMLVANYCGNLHVTTRGVMVAWEFLDDKEYTTSKNPKHPVSHAQKPNGPDLLEAKWDSDGAVCLDTPRLLYRDSSTAQVPKEFEYLCDNGKCESYQSWIDAVRKCKPDGTKYPPGYQPPPKARKASLPACNDCKNCKGRRYHSYVVKGPQ
jgi:hypothetical protein